MLDGMMLIIFCKHEASSPPTRLPGPFWDIHFLQQKFCNNPFSQQFLITDNKLLMPEYLSQFSCHQVTFLLHSCNHS